MAGITTGTTYFESFGTTSPVTGSAPTANDATDGMVLKDLNGITVAIKTNGAVNLSGAGTLQGYTFDSVVGVWTRAKHLDLTVDATSITAQSFEPFEVLSARNARVKWVPSGVTFASGSGGVTVYVLGFNEDLRGRY
jgi:hypothetical protein